MTVTLPLTQAEEAQLRELASQRGVPAEDIVLGAIKNLLPVRSPRDKVAALRAILEGDAKEQKETGDFLLRALDEDRLSDRKLYS
jgi:hypothetical protein